MQCVSQNNDIILDFFSGSATTAHAVMQLNAEDGGTRQFIMVQLPEKWDEKSEAFKAGYKNICEIGKERIRRAGKKIKEETKNFTTNQTNQHEQEELALNIKQQVRGVSEVRGKNFLDSGFKVFRLANSNYKAWENYKGTDIKKLEELFKENTLVPNWKEEDLLTEVMLLEGFPLDSKIEVQSQFKKNTVKKITSDFDALKDIALYICLDRDIHKETIVALKLSDKERFICLDSAVDDQSKITLEDKNLIKTL